MIGQRFSRRDNKIKMPVPSWVDGNYQELEKLENVISTLFTKVKDGKEIKVGIRLEPFASWPFLEYINCFVKCSVKWLLGSADEFPKFVILLLESMDHVTKTDDCIEKCVADWQKGNVYYLISKVCRTP